MYMGAYVPLSLISPTYSYILSTYIKLPMHGPWNLEKLQALAVEHGKIPSLPAGGGGGDSKILGFIPCKWTFHFFVLLGYCQNDSFNVILNNVTFRSIINRCEYGI
mgnify:CR=1 FL=1